MRNAERVVVGRIVATLLTGSLAIALAGCGGGDSGTSSTGTSSTTNPFAPATGATSETNSTSGSTEASTGSTSGSTADNPAAAAPAPAPAATASSSNVTLGWQPPTTNSNGSPITDLAGYKIHYGTTSANYTQTVSVANAGLTRYVVENLAKGTYYFAISAYNAQGLESELSAEVSETVN